MTSYNSQIPCKMAKFIRPQNAQNSGISQNIRYVKVSPLRGLIKYCFLFVEIEAAVGEEVVFGVDEFIKGVGGVDFYGVEFFFIGGGA